MIPLSLYIHIPWCVKKCPYCDFNSHQARDTIPEDDYTEKLIFDLEQELPQIWGRHIQTVFIGGGTPSLFSPKAYEKLFRNLRARLTFSPNTEITMEVNPGAVEQDRFAGYLDAGINRLSLGIQSFQDDKLLSLGRIHNSTDAITAINHAKKAGFTNFNIDLMYGLPQQSHNDALYDLASAIALEPTHLSWYQLTLEPNTHFAKFPPRLPNDDKIWEIQEKGLALLATTPFKQYEISAFSQQHYQCQHNRNYWEFGDYIGIGAGAHGKVTDFAHGTIKRKWKIKHPKHYLSAIDVVAGVKTLSSEEIALEFMMNALRLNEAVPISLFEERTTLTYSQIETRMAQAVSAGFIETATTQFTTTTLGKQFLNDLVQIFL